MVEKTGITDRERVFEELRKEGYENLYIWSDPPGTYYNWHIHPFDEVRWILEGEITIGTREKVFHLKPGDKLRVPARTEHWAEVSDKGVTYVCGTKR